MRALVFWHVNPPAKQPSESHANSDRIAFRIFALEAKPALAVLPSAPLIAPEKKPAMLVVKVKAKALPTSSLGAGYLAKPMPIAPLSIAKERYAASRHRMA